MRVVDNFCIIYIYTYNIYIYIYNHWSLWYAVLLLHWCHVDRDNLRLLTVIMFYLNMYVYCIYDVNMFFFMSLLFLLEHQRFWTLDDPIWPNYGHRHNHKRTADMEQCPRAPRGDRPQISKDPRDFCHQGFGWRESPSSPPLRPSWTFQMDMCLSRRRVNKQY